ncbi:MAG: SDR family NAD(P)-dependent oxidoreductase [Candidatus Dormibacterales bacterium]
MRIKGSVTLVTGASSGIGEATALAFARRGARLALCARRLDRIQAVAEACRRAGAQEVTIRRVDVRRREQARSFVAGAVRDFGRVDVLVNNAGLGWRGRLQEMPAAEALAMVETNLCGLLWTTQAALPHMLARRSGVIVNIASVVGFRANPYSALYSATKHAVVGLSHALRGELSGSGVKVSVVYPAATETEFFDHLEHAAVLGPRWTAEKVAHLVVRAVRRPRRDVIVFPMRAGHLAEPVVGGVLDHALGELMRRAEPGLRGPGELPPEVDEPE